MAQILVENLDPVIIEKLETLAKQHGRSLQEELKQILQQAAEKSIHSYSSGDMTKAREVAFRIRQQLALQGYGVHTSFYKTKILVDPPKSPDKLGDFKSFLPPFLRRVGGIKSLWCYSRRLVCTP